VVTMSERVTCFEEDPRLIKVDNLAYDIYRKGNHKAHNYDHARWDAERAAEISMIERPSFATLTVAAALMHDTGASIGEYKDHGCNSGVLVRMHFPHFGYSPFEVGLIARAVEQHNQWKHTNDVSRILYDADTLNKAGEHGIQQCNLVGEEFGLPLIRKAERFSPYFRKLFEKGYYTDKAKEIDLRMGNERFAGLEMTVAFWEKINQLIREGTLQEEEMMKVAKIEVGLTQ